MHLLAAKPGVVSDGAAAVDLGQTPSEIVILSSADTELACLAAAQSRLGPNAPSLRLANLLQLGHNLSVDLYLDRVVQHARLVILRLLGGPRYWPYGMEQLSATCRERAIAFAALPGDDQPDPEMLGASTVPAESAHRLWRYCVEGGVENATNLLGFAATVIGRDGTWREPMPLLRAGFYLARRNTPRFGEVSGGLEPNRPTGAGIFFRAVVEAGKVGGNGSPGGAVGRGGFKALPIFPTGLK